MIPYLLIIIYALFGVFMENKGWIQKPTYWSLYGFAFGVFLTTVFNK